MSPDALYAHLAVIEPPSLITDLLRLRAGLSGTLDRLYATVCDHGPSIVLSPSSPISLTRKYHVLPTSKSATTHEVACLFSTVYDAGSLVDSHASGYSDHDISAETASVHDHSQPTLTVPSLGPSMIVTFAGGTAMMSESVTVSEIIFGSTIRLDASYEPTNA